MSKLDRVFADMRERALAHPLTEASHPVMPEASLADGTLLGLSFNL